MLRASQDVSAGTRSSSAPRPSSAPRWNRALVTGASSGIGASIAGQLAAAGVELVLVARRGDRLESLAQRLRDEHGVAVEVLVADLTDRGQRERVQARLADAERPVDLLVNNAGGGAAGPVAAFSPAFVVGMLELNAGAVLALTAAALPPMIERGAGTILTIGAGNGLYPVPNAAVYAASKGFVLDLTQALAHELRGTGVEVCVACPGFTRTEAQAKAGLAIERVPSWAVESADRVAAASLRAAAKGRTVAHVGRGNRLAAFVLGHLPRRIVVPLAARSVQRILVRPGASG